MKCTYLTIGSVVDSPRFFTSADPSKPIMRISFSMQMIGPGWLRRYEEGHYGLNCVPTKFICWSPQCYGVCICIWRWGLWKVITVRWGPWGLDLKMELVLLLEETPDSTLAHSLLHTLSLSFSFSLSFSHCRVRTQREGSSLQARKKVLTRTWLWWPSDLRLPASRLWENKFLFFQPLSLWYLVMAAHSD